MKKIIKYLDSNTSSFVPTSYYNTSNYPFIPVQIYLVNLFNPISVVGDKLIEFSDEIGTKNINQELKPKAGFLKGTFMMKDEFNNPIEDFFDYM